MVERICQDKTQELSDLNARLKNDFADLMSRYKKVLKERDELKKERNELIEKEKKMEAREMVFMNEIHIKENEITRLRNKAVSDKENERGQGPAYQSAGPVNANAKIQFDEDSGNRDFQTMI